MSISRLVSLATLGIAGAIASARTFSSEEVRAIQAFWNAPGRYRTSLPESASKNGMWQVRLTTTGSTWIWKYNKLKGVGKVPPTQDAGAVKPEQQPWDAWMNAKVDWDRYQATLRAREYNERDMGAPILSLDPVSPADPGPMPQDLAEKMGQEMPIFANAVKPMAHSIRFDDEAFTYTDNTPMRAKYAYYRFEQGVMDVGTPVSKISENDMNRLYDLAHLNGSIARVMNAISPLEGGFDSINTYDTGYLSVGFIQFATLKDGAGSLGGVLSRFQRNDPEAFALDFRRFGIDVTFSGKLITLDLETGQEKMGPDAVQQIIDDKRLTAVFQRAGRRDGFRVAQLQVARESYYPADDTFTLNGQQVRIADIFRSEAGLATLMDRKVNTGKLDPLPALAQKLWTDYNLQDPMDLAAFEPLLIQSLKYRGAYLGKDGLSQPDPTRCRPLAKKI